MEASPTPATPATPATSGPLAARPPVNNILCPPAALSRPRAAYTSLGQLSLAFHKQHKTGFIKIGCISIFLLQLNLF